MTDQADASAAPTRPAVAARRLATQGPGATPSGAGPIRRLMRGLALRLMGPYSAHQQTLDTRIIDAIDDLDRRLREQEQLHLGSLAEDLIEALETLRSRVAAGEDVIEGSRALPYMSEGALERFRDPFAGVVVGYRNGSKEAGETYRGFEEVFRGPEARVLERQRVFVELFDGHGPVLDAGCGRGEFLDLLRDAGLQYAGVDIDEAMVERCRAKGHTEVHVGTANDYLRRLPDAQLGAVFSAQVIEHMPYTDLVSFFELSRGKLRDGGVLVAETMNPHAPHALKTFWVDPTHQHPLFPEVALVLCRLAGFESAYFFHPLGTGHVDDDRYRESEYAVVATKNPA